MKNHYPILIASLLSAGLVLALSEGLDKRPDHASEFYRDVDQDARCTYWGQDATGDDVALCKSRGYLVYCVAGPHGKPACTAVVNLNPPAPATGSGK